MDQLDADEVTAGGLGEQAGPIVVRKVAMYRGEKAGTFDQARHAHHPYFPTHFRQHASDLAHTYLQLSHIHSHTYAHHLWQGAMGGVLAELLGARDPVPMQVLGEDGHKGVVFILQLTRDLQVRCSLASPALHTPPIPPVPHALLISLSLITSFIPVAFPTLPVLPSFPAVLITCLTHFTHIAKLPHIDHHTHFTCFTHANGLFHLTYPTQLQKRPTAPAHARAG